MEFLLEWNKFELVSDEDIKFLFKEYEIRNGFQIFDRLSKMEQSLRSDFSGLQKYGLSDNEGKVIFSYTYSGYEKLNKIILSGKLDINPVYKKYFELLKLCLNKIPDYRGIVYREIKNIVSYQVGEIIEWDIISSCTKNEELIGSFNGKTVFTIECSRGKDISNIAVYADEEEVVLLPSKFEVLSVDGNNIHLKQI